jgi:hypothetical protein
MDQIGSANNSKYEINITRSVLKYYSF